MEVPKWDVNTNITKSITLPLSLFPSLVFLVLLAMLFVVDSILRSCGGPGTGSPSNPLLGNGITLFVCVCEHTTLEFSWKRKWAKSIRATQTAIGFAWIYRQDKNYLHSSPVNNNWQHYTPSQMLFDRLMGPVWEHIIAAVLVQELMWWIMSLLMLGVGIQCRETAWTLWCQRA